MLSAHDDCKSLIPSPPSLCTLPGPRVDRRQDTGFAKRADGNPHRSGVKGKVNHRKPLHAEQHRWHHHGSATLEAKA